MDINIDGLCYTYPNGVRALHEVDLTIRTGEQVAIVGQNGAGKTTLVKHLNGLLKPSGGEVRIGDWNTQTYSVAQLSSRVGYVFQNPDQQLFCSNVYQEAAFGPTNLRYKEAEVTRLVEGALRLTGLQGKEETNPYDLSPTWRKMVAVASILAMDTPIVILDEPTTGQDAVNIHRFTDIVTHLRKQGKTTIAITHDIDFGAENFDRMIVMSQGQVLLEGPVREVVSRVDTLAESYVDPPQLTRLGMELGFTQTVSREEEFLAAYRVLIMGRSS
ncbi:MAG: ABC transporter ATP-binding protein [Anaerolineales bacterium]|nr:ABC transporter ATP-binding protein [Anaerolineales bacterium]